ncbi:MAG: glycosyltransferase family 4 protein [Acidobacteriota bacterium]
MKILVGMPSKDSWGGPIACEPPFVESLRQFGHQVFEETYVYGENEKSISFFERIQRVVKTALRFRKLLKNNSFDIIHLNTAFDLKTILRDAFSIFLMKPGNAKIFLKLHGSKAEAFQKTSFIVNFLIRYLSRKVDGFGVLSQEEKENFIRLSFDENKIYRVKNVIDIDQKQISSRKSVSKVKDDFFELIYVSRFIPTKGLLETIRACKILADSGYRFRLHCLGDGETRQNAEKEAKKLGLDKTIIFTGYIPEDEVDKHLIESDILIFPSRHNEGFPMVIFKAVALGIPLVTTKIRAAADYLVENENALFCTQEPEIIAEKIIILFENQQLQSKMSQNNLAFGKSLLPDKIANEFLEIYQKIIAG